MPFRLHQFLRLVAPLLFVLCALNFVHVDRIFARMVGRYALVAVVALGGAGALLGLVFLFVGVRFRCPFCGKVGHGAVEGNGRPWMECAGCGTIHCQGLLGLRIVREPPSDDGD